MPHVGVYAQRVKHTLHMGVADHATEIIIEFAQMAELQLGSLKKRSIPKTRKCGLLIHDREGLQSYLDDYNQKLIEVFQAEAKDEQIS
ncbi:hypothetical protein TOC8171_28840 [Pseudomonas syringae]